MNQLANPIATGIAQNPLFDALREAPDTRAVKLPVREAIELPQITAHTLRDFRLQSGATLETARAGWCIYATENGAPINLSKFRYPEVELGREVIVVLPALTGSARAKVADGVECSQGDGWGNHWIDSQARLDREARLNGTKAASVFLDSDRYTIIVVDHFGGNGAPGSTTSARELFEQGVAEQVTIADGVHLIAAALRERGLQRIHAVIGGSIGGGQAFHWMFQNDISVSHVVDISGSSCQDQKAREFFRIQRDLLSDNPDMLRLRTRMLATVSDLLKAEQYRSPYCQRVRLDGRVGTAFEYVVDQVDRELQNMTSQTSIKERLECARRLGFLLFVPPDFYQEKFERYHREEGADRARIRLDNWFARQGEEFSKRFTPEALWTLCNMNAECEMISPQQVAERMLETGVTLTGTAVHGDTLFLVGKHRALYQEIEECLSSLGIDQVESLLKSVQIIDRVLGHDSFFDPQSFDPLGEIIRQRLN